MDERLEIQGRVVEVRKQVIPKMYTVTLETEEGDLVEFDAHEDLVVYKAGEKLSFTLSKSLPEYNEEMDFVGRGTIASVRREDDKLKILVSVGGLLFMITTSKDFAAKPTEKFYIKIAKMSN